MAVNTNKTDKLGALMYNIKYLTGFPLGGPKANDILFYSDLVLAGKVFLQASGYLTNAVDPNAAVFALAYDALGAVGVTKSFSIDEELWETGDYFFMGQKWLPWFAPPPDPEHEGFYLLRKNYEGDTRFNPWTLPVLKPTLLSLAKVAGIGIVSYYSLKYGYKAIRKYSSR